MYMADNSNDVKCSWCSNYGAKRYFREENGESQYSSEMFCSKKCMTEYSDRYTIAWKTKPPDYMAKFRGCIVIALLVFVVVPAVISGIIKSCNNNNAETSIEEVGADEASGGDVLTAEEASYLEQSLQPDPEEFPEDLLERFNQQEQQETVTADTTSVRYYNGCGYSYESREDCMTQCAAFTGSTCDEGEATGEIIKASR